MITRLTEMSTGWLRRGELSAIGGSAFGLAGCCAGFEAGNETPEHGVHHRDTEKAKKIGGCGLAVFASSLAFENTEFAEATENTLRTNGFWEEAENWGRKQDCQA